ncbi:MAG: DHHW family protein [Lachnospiraceae bacterium]|nr:DHHW family protein [Ruminococcus sp.]MCM1273865.1 DHHW family protein [Lachnospiraceae bacterium]
MKKTVYAFVAAALALSLAGCGGTDNPSSGVSAPSPVSTGSKPESSSAPESSGSSESGSESSSESVPESNEESSSAEESTESSHEKPDVHGGEQGGEMSGSVLVLDDGRAVDLYGGGYERGQNYAETLNKLKKLVGDGVNVFSLVAPTAVSFYLPESLSYMSGSEWDNIDYLNGFFDGVIPVDAYSALAKHVDEDIYFRTDHHWQPLGAYYAAEEFAKTAMVPFAPLSDYETVTMEGYVGTMYGYSGENPLVKNNPDTFTYYKPTNEYTVTYYTQSLEDPYEAGMFLKTVDNLAVVQWYMVFFGGDAEVAHIHTDVGNGRKLVIVKDSYGNAFAPCLANSFEDIWVVDMRGFEKSISQLVKDEGLTDVLFCMNSFSATGDNQYKLADKL